MSSPQQPWSPGRPAPTDPPQPGGSPASGHGAPQGYGVPLGYGSPQAHGAPRPGQAPQPSPVQPEPYGGGPTGELVIDVRKPFGAMGMISPVVTIDGHPTGSTWGRNVFQVPAGVRQVDVAQTSLWTYGRASHPVDVEPGRTSEIFYAGPMATFGFGGAIGPGPQKRPGRGLFIGLMVVLVLMVLLVVLSVAVGSS